MRDRLGNRDWLFRCKVMQSSVCLLCEDGVESRDHLFFECPFGFAVWSGVLSLMGSSHWAAGGLSHLTFRK